MIWPSVDKLLKRVDSKYTLVIAASKRARELAQNTKYNAGKPVTVALQEIDQGIITYLRLKQGEK
ncbi:MAG: DNA-directed RNA polymerase subunit omega [Firmicutes bacterium]|nr:DNA-directed RNA polymerase subunit omega [Dethiobacter sp.]MBS3888573.1 DNA-directed RNA polymerase subunit omega [Bacillota bacterium]MBS4054137.1 DNA-directed RNA polymerase subunit omega [Thermaerobacter sp.]